MDSFTENILARARERQKLLEGYNNGETPKTTLLKDRNASSPKASSQPNLGAASPKKKIAQKEVSSEPNLSRFRPESKENQSEDNVRVEVQIEEHEESDDDGGATQGLREDAKKRLNRLGQLYAGGEDAGISSPIHRTEAKFGLVEDSEVARIDSEPKTPRKGLKKLAALAENMNRWEDDVSLRKEKPEQSTKKIWKPPAPQPPETPKSSPVKPLKPKAPNPPKIVSESPKKDSQKSLNWDQKVLDSLESQGFTRTQSSSKLIYKYDSEGEKEVKTAGTTKLASKSSENVIEEEDESEEEEKSPVKPKSPVKTINKSVDVAKRAAIFESGSPSKSATKDPALLSVSERKALFEKNKGAALVPKAAFAMAIPANKSDTPGNKVKRVKSPAPKPPVNVPKPKEISVETPKPKVAVKNPKRVEIEPKTSVSQSMGIAHTVAALFESKSTISSKGIENEIREQRRKDMDMLCNRFNRNKTEEPEIAEEYDDLDDVTEETAMIKPSEKAPKVVPPPPPPPVVACSSGSGEGNRKSGGNKRCSKNDSPKVKAVLNDVKRIKVSPKKAGRLYPSLTDIESATETEHETDQNPSRPNSSFEESFAESDEVNTSFGRDVLRTVCQNNTPQKRVINDSSSSDNMSDLLDGMDDYIDEALAYDEAQGGPTPPKLGKQSPKNVAQPSNSFNYKSGKNEQFQSPSKSVITPRKSEVPTYVVDGDNVMPLTHTVSFYRKQQTLSANNTPVRQISRQPVASSNRPSSEASYSNERHLVEEKMKQLQAEVQKQQMIISQTSQALNLCNSTPEFMGSTEQVEAERVLLVATHRRQAALHELQRLEVEKCLRPQGQHSRNLPLEKGTLTISNIVVPLKQKYVTALAAAGGMGHHVVCLIKCGEQVAPTQLVSTVASNRKNLEMDLRIPGKIKLDNIYSDFTITFEVYCLQAQEEFLPHDVKYHIKRPNSKVTPKKSKQDSRLVRPIMESPAGPNAVRSPTFALMGYVVFAVQAINKKHWTLNNAPSMSPLEGTVEMAVTCELAMSVEHRGFLTMFEDVSGFGAWHRRWCLLKGHTLSYWKYPDDERKTPPIDSINLKHCITKETGPVSRDICARLHTFLLERERVAHPQDKDTLVMIRKGDKTVIRHLLSADTKEERVEWCNKVNAALTAIRMWGDK